MKTTIFVALLRMTRIYHQKICSVIAVLTAVKSVLLIKRWSQIVGKTISLPQLPVPTYRLSVGACRRKLALHWLNFAQLSRKTCLLNSCTRLVPYCDFLKSAYFNKMPPVSGSFEVSRDPPDIESLLALNPKTKVINGKIIFFCEVY